MAVPPAAPDIEPYYTEAEIARLLDPSGRRIKARSIRSERVKQRLVSDMEPAYLPLILTRRTEKILK